MGKSWCFLAGIMAEDPQRNFRSAYYEKVGFRGVEEKKSLEILMKDNPLGESHPHGGVFSSSDTVFIHSFKNKHIIIYLVLYFNVALSVR